MEKKEGGLVEEERKGNVSERRRGHERRTDP